MTPAYLGRIRVGDEGFGHAVLRILVPGGHEVLETVQVQRTGIETVEVLASPARLIGFAAGDVLRVNTDGTFALLRCGPNACVQVYAAPALTTEKLERLRKAFDPLAGLVEAPPNLRFAVLTVPWAAGAQRIKELMTSWAAEDDARIKTLEWQFGNSAP